MAKKKKKTAADVFRELGIPADNSKSGKVSIRVPARALRGKRPGGRSAR